MSHSEYIVGICKNHHLQEGIANNSIPQREHCQLCSAEIKYIWYTDMQYGQYKHLEMNPFIIGFDFDSNYLYRIPSREEIKENELWNLSGQYVSKERYDRERTDYDDYMEDEYKYSGKKHTSFCEDYCDGECKNCPYIAVKMCSKCGGNPAQELHLCPYQTEVHADYEFECDCCEECERLCNDDV